MNKIETLIHPVKIRILQYLSVQGEATPGELAGCLEGVSKASVYNHIKTLEEMGILEVVRQRPVRGTIEKTYRVSEKGISGGSAEIMAFLLSLMLDFQNYYQECTCSEEAAVKRDMLFAGRDYFCLSDEQYEEFVREYTDLCARYYEQSRKGEKLRSVSIISSPVNEWKKEE